MILAGIFISFHWLLPLELENLRSQYLAAALDKNQLSKLESSCSSTSYNEPASNGYCIMVHFLEAKNAFNPYRKLSEFSEGKRKLDSLIAHHSENIELRYMRHSIQERVPGFLGYNDQLAEDEHFMTTNLNSVSDSSTYQLIYNYLHHRN